MIGSVIQKTLGVHVKHGQGSEQTGLVEDVTSDCGGVGLDVLESSLQPKSYYSDPIIFAVLSTSKLETAAQSQAWSWVKNACGGSKGNVDTGSGVCRRIMHQEKGEKAIRVGTTPPPALLVILRHFLQVSGYFIV